MRAALKTLALALLVSIIGTGAAAAACKKDGCCNHTAKSVAGAQLSASDQLRMLEAVKTMKNLEGNAEVSALKQQQAGLIGDQAKLAKDSVLKERLVASTKTAGKTCGSCDDCDDCDSCDDCHGGSSSDCDCDCAGDGLNGKTATLQSECGHGTH